MTALQRRCRLLLAYPAGYRRERGAEILGTLLEATPAGRNWPLPRDSGSLVMGGLRARGAQNRRLPMASNLRLAVLFGLSVYLGFAASRYLSGFAYAKLSPRAAPAGWLVLSAGLLIASAVVLAWLARRTAVIPAVLAAGAVTAITGSRRPSGLGGIPRPPIPSSSCFPWPRWRCAPLRETGRCGCGCGSGCGCGWPV